MANKDFLLYISPANHHKRYIYTQIDANGNTVRFTEKQQMEKLAELTKKELEENYDGVKVVIATVFSPNGDYVGRPEEAKKLGANAYVAQHTNAAGNWPAVGNATGACVFYHPNFPESKGLALEIVKELNKVCPIRSNRAAQPSIYPFGKDWNLGELREPAKLGIPPVLIEHEFHDHPKGSKWIVKNLNVIAKADADAIARFYGFKKKEKVDATPVTPAESKCPFTLGDIVYAGKANIYGTPTSTKALNQYYKDAPVYVVMELTNGRALVSWFKDEKAEGIGYFNIADLRLATVGDVNGDGKVNTLDASLILRNDAGLIDFTDAQERLGDVNGDGKTNTLDASIVLRKDAGLID